ncbi:MAG: flagellar hook-basal body complex protein FliE [Candidatus Margulisbacteria bacterium]|nr:flagellar hook-basal body complex protein FliE [Candidatus Margulisiibacteriota bacterium]
MSDMSINSIGVIGNEQAVGKAGKGFATEFSNMLKQNIEETNSLLNKADNFVQDYTVNKTMDLHEVMIAVEEASMALNYTMQVRNRIIEGYQELMRIQV